jgi:hypothetical protein
LAVAFGIGTAFFCGVKVKVLNQFCPLGFVVLAPQVNEEVDDFAPCQVGPKVNVAGNIGDALVDFHRVVPCVFAEHFYFAACGLQDAQQAADGGGFARPVGPDVGKHLPFRNLQIYAFKRGNLAEVLVKVRYFHVVIHRDAPFIFYL